MSEDALQSGDVRIRGGRFEVRFLGRRGAWIWFAATGAVAFAAWFLMAVPARGEPAAQRTWYLWSGNAVFILFFAAMLFVARKWSIKLAYFRRYGAVGKGAGDASWAAIQDLNAKIRKGAFANDAEILAEAETTLRRIGTHTAERAELRELETDGRVVKYLHLRKRERFGRLEAWLEMHMGVGAVACIAVLLHADLVLRHPIGWALFVLSMVVFATGVIGAVLYRTIPEKLAKADTGIPYEEAGVARENYQLCVDGILATLDDAGRAPLAALASPARSQQELTSRSGAALAATSEKKETADLGRDLVVMAGSRDQLAFTTATARRYDLWLRLWRWIHVPATIALYGFILLHIWVVLYY